MKLELLNLGEVDRYLNFKLESGTSVYKSCTATMNGGTFVFGGHYDDGEKSNSRQVSGTQIKSFIKRPISRKISYGGRPKLLTEKIARLFFRREHSISYDS